MKLLITQALIKGSWGALCWCQPWRGAMALHQPRNPWEQRKTPLPQCLAPAARTAAEPLPDCLYSARAQPLLRPQDKAKTLWT